MILVLRALGIGDLATAVPALRGLRAAFPGRTVALAAPGWLAPLADLVDAVDQLVPVGELAPVPVECPYWAVNLHGRGPQSHRLLQATEPATLCAFACSAAGHLDGPLWIEEEHEVARWCRLLRWYGIAADPDDLALLRPPAGTMPVGATVVHPGAKDAARRWPVERFAAVARTLARRGHRVVVTGSVADAPAAAEVVRRAGLPPSAVLASGTVGELAAVIAHARLLVSGDTGAAHLATAYRTPSLVLFGSMPPHRWGPPPERAEHRSLWHDELAWLPAGAGPHPALRAITVDEVLAAADQLSRQLSRSG